MNRRRLKLTIDLLQVGGAAAMSAAAFALWGWRVTLFALGAAALAGSFGLGWAMRERRR